MNTFNINDRVICINDKIGYPTNKKLLNRGTIYIIRGLSQSDFEDDIGLLLYNVYTNMKHRNGNELGFNQIRFRKIIPECDRIKNVQKNEIEK